MDTKKLRQKILDLAIHGKLVPQDPNDEPASVLLERIREEKSRLIKEGKIKKPKKSVASDTSHYENVPQGWCLTTLGNVFSLQAGKNISASDINDYSQKYPYPCYGGNGIRGYVSNYNHEGNYPIIGRQGALCGNVNYAQGKFYATEHAVVVTYFSGVDVAWARYTLEALNLNQYATATAQPGLSVATVNDVTILLPPLKEQKRISKKLKECLDYIEVLCKNTSEFRLVIDSAKSKILDLAIRGKLVPQDSSDEPASELLKRLGISSDNRPYKNVPFEVPQGWEWTCMNEVNQYKSASIDPSKEPNTDYELYSVPTFETGFPEFVKGKNISSSKKVVQRDDVLLCKINPHLNRAWIVTHHKEERLCIASSEWIIFRNKEINPEYLSLCFTSPYFKELMMSNVSGVGGSLMRAQPASVIKYTFPLPPHEEQYRIVNKVNELFSQLDEIESSLQA